MTLSLANWDALGVRGRICAIQQSSIFTRVSLARLVNEVRRIRLIERVTAAAARAAGTLGAGGARARLPPLPDLPRPPPVRPARRAPGPRRLPDRRGDGGLDARLHARRAAHPDPPDADDRADGPAGDEGQDHPPERSLVPGRARRRRLPPAALARGADGLQPRPARPPRRQQGRGVAHRRLRLPGHGVSRLALRLRVSAGAAAALLRRGGGADAVPRVDHLGRRRGDAARGAGDGAVSAPAHPARLGELGRVAARHVPLPDLLAPRHARGVARPVANRPGRALRAEQDGPRDARRAPRARPAGRGGSGSSAATGWAACAGTATPPPAPESASRPSRRARSS